MKKVFVLLMAVLYLTVSSGLAVELHHCMGEIKDCSLAASNSNKCSSCGMTKGSNKCCKDELKFIKLQDSHKLLTVDYKLSIPETDLHNNHYLINNNPVNLPLVTDGKSQSPPGYSSTSLHILYSVFRIWQIRHQIVDFNSLFSMKM